VEIQEREMKFSQNTNRTSFYFFTKFNEKINFLKRPILIYVNDGEKVTTWINRCWKVADFFR